MINIKKFVQIRKKLKLSQTELCKGICTQATLSKFENLGRIPSMKIMSQLCERMNISLSDLIEDDTQTESVVSDLFEKADFNLITFDFKKIAELLEKIEVDNLSTKDRWHYTYLKGIVLVLKDNDLINGLYYFNQILTDPDITQNDIYYILAEAGCGEVYTLQNDFVKAEHFYDRVFNVVLQTKIKDNQTAIKVLRILYTGGVFYAEKKDFETSDSLLKYAYRICAENHHVFYLARIMYQLAVNAKAEQKSNETIQEYISDALAFGKLNGNHKLIKDIAEFQRSLD